MSQSRCRADVADVVPLTLENGWDDAPKLTAMTGQFPKRHRKVGADVVDFQRGISADVGELMGAPSPMSCGGEPV